MNHSQALSTEKPFLTLRHAQARSKTATYKSHSL